MPSGGVSNALTVLAPRAAQAPAGTTVGRRLFLRKPLTGKGYRRAVEQGNQNPPIFAYARCGAFLLRWCASHSNIRGFGCSLVTAQPLSLPAAEFPRRYKPGGTAAAARIAKAASSPWCAPNRRCGSSARRWRSCRQASNRTGSARSTRTRFPRCRLYPHQRGIFILAHLAPQQHDNAVALRGRRVAVCGV